MKAGKGRNTALLIFELSIILPALAGGAWLAAREPSQFSLMLIFWAALVAGVELMPVPAWRGLQLSLGFPVLMMVGILYAPVAAGAIALFGSADPREFRREISVLHSVFNRCQVALSVFASSSVFHALVAHPRGGGFLRILVAMLAAIADYLVNTTVVTLYVWIKTGLRPIAVMKQLRIGRLSEFLVSYLGLGGIGLALAVLYWQVGLWVLPAAFAPLLFARQVFFRSQAL